MIAKEFLLENYRKVWGNDEQMAKYCTNKVLEYFILRDGFFVAFDKKPIEKDFPCGYGYGAGRDCDEAYDLAKYKSESVDYFISRNMSDYEEEIEHLEYMFGCKWGAFRNNPKGNEIYIMVDANQWYDLYDRQGKLLFELTDDEKREYIKVLKSARDKHRKKVDTYLKKYGLSKVRTWVYWADE